MKESFSQKPTWSKRRRVIIGDEAKTIAALMADNPRLDNESGSSHIFLSNAQREGLYPLAKRLFDIIGSTLGLISFWLLFPFIALAIKIDSPGLIFYRQVRIGKGGAR